MESFPIQKGTGPFLLIYLFPFYLQKSQQSEPTKLKMTTPQPRSLLSPRVRMGSRHPANAQLAKSANEDLKSDERSQQSLLEPLKQKSSFFLCNSASKKCFIQLSDDLESIIITSDDIRFLLNFFILFHFVLPVHFSFPKCPFTL